MNFAKTIIIACITFLSINIAFAQNNFTIQVNDAETQLTVNSNFDGVKNKQTLTDVSGMNFFKKFEYIAVETTTSNCSVEIAKDNQIKVYNFNISFDELKAMIDLAHIDFSNLDESKIKQHDFSSTKEKYKMIKDGAVAANKVVDGNKTTIDVTLVK
ncbi:MAG: hypothetical protein ACPG4Z_01300 [Chitinophagales bacterium]